ncbi:MAG: N-acetylmuramoyl-L-alanine amidase [Myxococcales bacterium]|nr:N-acetylmuramoyl-L-alanine amidase [Myxococcales bacterium]
MLATWAQEGEWLVSPRLDAPEGASRAGVLLGLVAPGQVPVVEARVWTEDGAGTWQPLERTWSDEDQLVATVDFAAIGTAAELRVRLADMTAFGNIRFAAVIPDQLDALDLADDAVEVAGAAAELRAELRGLGIVTRDQWGARPTRCTSTDATKRRIAVHHTVSSSTDPARQLRGIQIYHQDTRGWCDVGYHFLIGSDGKVYEGRPLHLIGAHVGGGNTGNIGISFIGCYHTSGCAGLGPSQPAQSMVTAAGRLMGTLRQLYGINLSASTVMGHGQHPGQSTSCPGANLRPRVGEMIELGRTQTLASTGGGSTGGGSTGGGSTGGGSTGGGASTPGSCNHTWGGVYGHLACSASYQCCNGSWRSSGACGACGCTETTGQRGCTPEPAPAPVLGESCDHVYGGHYVHLGCSASYQCCDGRWRTRGSCGSCACVEESGSTGCGGSTTPPPGPSTGLPYAGLTLSGSEIPRAGIANRTLENTLGVAVEPLGTLDSYEGSRFVRGRVSWFGSPRDTSGVTATETGAITGEVLRSLNDPLNPDAATLRSRPEDYYYVAMRWAYSPNGRAFWRDARLVVVNPRTGSAVVVRPVDWGPHTRTGRILDLSPQSLTDLGLRTDDDALVAFAPPGTPLGPVRR